MNDKPCCYGKCNQGRGCMLEIQTQQEERILAFLLALVVILVVLILCV